MTRHRNVILILNFIFKHLKKKLLRAVIDFDRTPISPRPRFSRRAIRISDRGGRRIDRESVTCALSPRTVIACIPKIRGLTGSAAA